ncbi:type II toxin-antitoxin system HicA family toxin [Xanthobacter oligotrophicus]|uniref:Type II toxin-antitoxin system HicA family toxin n=1 Tax=Xanthobacter oligotrophicus TaxID=2607286 RepID=A0ABW7A027_9HYPH
MSKRLDRMRANPSSDWTIEDVAALCREHDVACEAPRGGSSHYKVSHPSQAEILTVPFKRPIKPVYIRKLVAFIDAVEKAR